MAEFWLGCLHWGGFRLRIMPTELVIELDLPDQHCEQLEVLLFVLLFGFSDVGAAAVLGFVVVSSRVHLEDFVEWSGFEGGAFAW